MAKSCKLESIVKANPTIDYGFLVSICKDTGRWVTRARAELQTSYSSVRAAKAAIREAQRRNIPGEVRVLGYGLLVSQLAVEADEEAYRDARKAYAKACSDLYMFLKEKGLMK